MWTNLDKTLHVETADLTAFLRHRVTQRIAALRPTLVIATAIANHVSASKRIDKRLADVCLAAFNAAGYEGQVWWVKRGDHGGAPVGEIQFRVKGNTEYNGVRVYQGDAFKTWLDGFGDAPAQIRANIDLLNETLEDGSIGRTVAAIATIRTAREALASMLDENPLGAFVSETSEPRY
jgi:hypothetical protein